MGSLDPLPIDLQAPTITINFSTIFTIRLNNFLTIEKL